MIRAPMGDQAYWDKWTVFGADTISKNSEQIKIAPGNPAYRPQFVFDLSFEYTRMKSFCFMLIALLTGCANYPRLGLPLVQEDADRIKTIQVIVMAQQEPLRISRTRYDSSQTVALRTVGGFGGAIAANALEISANNRYIRNEEEARRITKPLLDQVDGMDYREVLRRQLEAALKRDGRFRITQVIGIENKYGDFGSPKYIQSSDADAVLFLSGSLEMMTDLGLSNQVYYQLVAKTGEVMLNEMMSFCVLPPEERVSARLEWWSNANRYREVVLHSGYAVATVLNDQLFGKSGFMTRDAFLRQASDADNRGKPVPLTLQDRQKLAVCNEMPSSDRYRAESYVFRQAVPSKMFDVALRCQGAQK